MGTTALDLFDAFATDTAREEEGSWVDYAPGVSFLIARSNNKGYSRALTKKFERNKLTLETKGQAAEDLAENIIVEVMAQHILLGWKGEFNWKGKPVGEYSVERAKEMLNVKDFRRWVVSKAEDFERFKLAQDEGDQGE